jgi:hypothetical protein
MAPEEQPLARPQRQEDDDIHQICEMIDAKLHAQTRNHSYSKRHDSYTISEHLTSQQGITSVPSTGTPHHEQGRRREDAIFQHGHEERPFGPRESISISITGGASTYTTSTTTAGPKRPDLNTVTSWTSNATRRQEYEKIDRAHSGLRGLSRRLLRNCTHAKTARRGFFTGDCDGDSVRRFRMDVATGEDDGNDTDREDDGQPGESAHEEKKVALGSSRACVEDTHESAKGKETTKTKYRNKKPNQNPWWTCFR